jgi:hypothetical protein
MSQILASSVIGNRFDCTYMIPDPSGMNTDDPVKLPVETSSSTTLSQTAVMGNPYPDNVSALMAFLRQPRQARYRILATSAQPVGQIQ